MAECRTLGSCPTGEARITRGYQLPARWVIHTVGPVWRGGTRGEAELLASCYRASLKLARANACKSVALPAVSCGVYGYPLDEAADVSIQAVRAELDEFDEPAMVRWVMFSPDVFDAWMRAWGRQTARC